MSLPSIKWQDKDHGTWFAIIYWHGGTAIHILDISCAGTEAELDAWLARHIDKIPLGDPSTGKVGAPSLAIFEVPRERTSDRMKSLPLFPALWGRGKYNRKPKNWI